MKHSLFILTIICFSFCGCKKNSQSGSPYTKSMSGTRHYKHNGIFYLNGVPTNTTDTVSLEIQYLNDGTVEINTTILTYNPAKSSDSALVFEHTSSSSDDVAATLSYNHFDSSVYYQISVHISAAGETDNSYWSF